MSELLPCPICNANLPERADVESPDFPFCSRRCRQIDLLRWTEGKYAIVEPLTLDRLLEETAKNETDGAEEP